MYRLNINRETTKLMPRSSTVHVFIYIYKWMTLKKKKDWEEIRESDDHRIQHSYCMCCTILYISNSKLEFNAELSRIDMLEREKEESIISTCDH